MVSGVSPHANEGNVRSPTRRGPSKIDQGAGRNCYRNYCELSEEFGSREGFGGDILALFVSAMVRALRLR